MTYRTTRVHRTMHGLGASPPALTSDQIGLLLKAVNNVGGCTPQLRTSMANVPCLNTQMVQWFGTCFGGVKPANMTDAEFASACASLSACGAFDKLGCPQDGAALMTAMQAQIPSCLTDVMAKEIGPMIDYCKATPTFDGPNKSANAACWAMSRFPDVYAKIMNIPLCTPPAPTPTAPPPAPAPTAPPSAEQPTSVTDTSASMTPTSTTTDVTTTTTEAGMSSTKMAMIGVGAVAVLGLGYLLLRKK